MSNGEKKVKRRKGRKKSLGLRKIVLALSTLVVAVCVVFTASRTVGSVALSNVTDAFAAFAHSFGDDSSYPFDLGGAVLHGSEAFGSGLLLVKNDNALSLNSSATQLISHKHTFSTPVAHVNNGRAVVYDRNARGLFVMGKSSLLCEMETEREILCAVMGKNGFVAVATLASEATSVMTVYDRQMQEYFKWKCVSDYISDMSISDDGNSIAVSVVGVSQADTRSTVHIFEFDKTEQTASFDYEGTLILDVEYIKNNTVAVLGDNLRSTIKDGSQRTDEAYSGDTLCCFDSADNGRTAVVLLTYGNESSPVLHVYAKNGELSFEKALSQPVQAVSCSGSYTAVLMQDSAEFFDNAGNQVGCVKLKNTAHSVTVAGSGAYIAFQNSVARCSINADNEEIG